MKVQKYFMRTQMHGTPTGWPDYKRVIRATNGYVASPRYVVKAFVENV